MYVVWKHMKKLFYANLTIYFLKRVRLAVNNIARFLYEGPRWMFYTSSVIIIIEKIEMDVN